jgi:hypothetical protein
MTTGLKQIGVVKCEDGYIETSGTFATLAYEDIPIANGNDVALRLYAHFCVKEVNELINVDGYYVYSGHYTATVIYDSGTPIITSSTLRDEEGSLYDATVSLSVDSDDIVLEIESTFSPMHYQCIGAFEIYAISYELGPGILLEV